MKNVTGPKNDIAYMRIMTNYFHYMYILYTYITKWDTEVYYLLKFVPYAIRSLDVFLMFDCLLAQTGYDYQPIYLKVDVVLILPVIFILLSSFYWRFLRCSKDKSTKKKIIMTFIILTYVALPVMANITLVIFYCVPLDDGGLYLVEDYSIQCWVGDHIIQSKVIGGLIVGLWLGALPLLTLYYLIKKR
jgi:hypothetical protein